MDGKIFRLTRIEGEYAYLAPIDGGEDIFIAMALLPPDVDVGTKLKYEMLEYEVIEE